MIGIVSENLNFLEKYNIDGDNACVFFDGYTSFQKAASLSLREQ
jgi:hypothetical protein